MEDDVYNGMFIPKGSIMIAHVWHLNRDPEIYGDDAAHFNPARFLDANDEVISLAPETKEEGHVTYGFGRRVCVGKHVANNSLFIDFAMMLWACKIEAKKDENGNDFIPNDYYLRKPDPSRRRPYPLAASCVIRVLPEDGTVEPIRTITPAELAGLVAGYPRLMQVQLDAAGAEVTALTEVYLP